MQQSDIILYSAISLDGYIARPNGSIDWLSAFENSGDDYGYTEFYNSINYTLMGRKTFDQVLSFDMPYPYADKTNFVVSRSLTETDVPNTSVIHSDLAEFVTQLKDNNEGRIWLIGGSELNGFLLKNKLIDHLILTTIPVLIGEGLPLFGGSHSDVNLKLEELTQFNSGIIQQVYTVLK